MSEQDLGGIWGREALKELADDALRHFPEPNPIPYRVLHVVYVYGTAMKISIPNRRNWLTALSNSAEAFAIELAEAGVPMKPDAIELAAALILATGPSDGDRLMLDP